MPRQPLNIFQRLVRSWEAVHPYNAAQVVKLAGLPDVGVIQNAWHDALAALGLGKLRTRDHAFHYELLNGEAERYPVRKLPGDTDLANHLSVEMNRAFDDPDEPPFRAFLLDGQGGYHLDVVYQHWVADSVSVRRLLQEWCGRILHCELNDNADHQEETPDDSHRATMPHSLPSANGHSNPIHTSPGYWRLYGGSNGRLPIDQAALSLFRSYIRFRTVQKVCMTGVGDYPVRVLLRELPAGLVDSLRAMARDQGVTVGDALLAALALACYRHVPMQRRPSRRDIAIGNIIDLRPHAPIDLSKSFGMFLGFTHVVCRREDLRDFSRLLRSVNLQNRARRRDGIAQASLAWMMAAMVAQRFNKPHKLYRFYRKEIPLAGGLSNVNLAGSWADAMHPSVVRDYLRISPTGPMAPLALSTTTLGSNMSLCLTYRPALIDEPGAEEIARDVIEQLVRLAECR